MDLIKNGVSAILKLAIVIIMLAAFVAGMAGVVYMSLHGEEIAVPEITGKDFFESEKELAALGLKIKRRADRPSTEKMNTVLEQLPRAGETVKSGQLIFVVVSKAGLEGETTKPDIKAPETDDSKTIEEMISDKPKRSKSSSNSNSNTKKKADTTRDTIANESEDSKKADDKKEVKPENSDKKETTVPPAGDKGNKSTSTPKPKASPARATSAPKPRSDTGN